MGWTDLFSMPEYPVNGTAKEKQGWLIQYLQTQVKAWQIVSVASWIGTIIVVISGRFAGWW